MAIPTPVSEQQIDALLPFLDDFEAVGFKPGEWNSDSPSFKYNGPVVAFAQALYKNGWIIPFDWGEWQATAQKLVDSHDLLAAADLETIRKLLTIHSRKDRFCERHLAAMFENGHIVAVLQRLKDIREEMGVEEVRNEHFG
jgi:hypothetical protein